jgi:uncharacterized membrane protein
MMSSSKNPLIPIRQLYREAYDLLKSQYLIFVALSYGLILISLFSPLAVLLGPSCAMIHAAIGQKQIKGQITLSDLPQCLPSSLDAFLAYMMLLASCFVFLVPTSLVIYYASSNWQSLTDQQTIPGELLLTVGLLIAPTLGVIQLSVCVPFLFTFCAIVQDNCNAVDAIKTSLTLITQNLSLVLRTSATLIAGHVVALMLFIIPAIFLLPLHFAALHLLYQKLAQSKAFAD